MKYDRLIMFCDYGLDDAVATLHILQNADMFAAIDIVPIGGNVTAETAYGNAHTLLYHAKADKAKVRIVDTRGIAQSAADIPEIHGKDGIGDILPAKPSDIPVVPFDAFKEQVKKTRTSRDCVLSLGPCTIPVRLGYVPFCTVLMGGTVSEPPNYGKYEFNEGMDASAFARLSYRSAAVATLDSCHDKKMRYDDICPGNALAATLVDKYMSMCKERNAPETVYDYVAALAVTHPERFDVVRVKRDDGVEFNMLQAR